jgi:head-tail adaptor
MERRISSRAQVDVPICALVDGFRHACRASELSPTGMVFERSRALAGRQMAQAAPFEIYLPGARPIRARARPVWSKHRILAVKFVMINDADRLTLAELLDGKVRLGQRLH